MTSALSEMSKKIISLPLIVTALEAMIAEMPTSSINLRNVQALRERGTEDLNDNDVRTKNMLCRTTTIVYNYQDSRC